MGRLGRTGHPYLAALYQKKQQQQQRMYTPDQFAGAHIRTFQIVGPDVI